MTVPALTRGQLAARGFDANHNGQVEELQMTRPAQNAIARGQGAATVEQLARAIDRDQVVVRDGRMALKTERVDFGFRDGQASPFDQLRRAQADVAKGLDEAHDTVGRNHPDEEDEFYKAKGKCEQASENLRQLLRTTRTQLTANDPVSTQIRQTIDATLRADEATRREVAGRSAATDTRAPEAIARSRFNDAKALYENLEHGTATLAELTKDLPDLAAQNEQLAHSIHDASHTLAQLGQTQSRTATDSVQAHLLTRSTEAQANVAGRWKAFGLGGLGVGVIAGAAAGFRFGHSVRTALIGAGVGAVATGTGGALIGRAIDRHFQQRSEHLAALSQEVTTFDRSRAEQRLGELAARSVQLASDAQRPTNDAAAGRQLSSQIEVTHQQVEALNQQAERVRSAYKVR